MSANAVTPVGVIPRNCKCTLHEGSRQMVESARRTTRFLTSARNATRFATRCNRIKAVLSTPDSRLTTHDFVS